ncbi:trypsin-like peptidase domain-containing protein [Streptomyces sp. NBC_00536]|uniref:S1C family serine protease n=1 Tax=Streptomyces sp. NBC_00536 TaxID=2975769 RepID=UPI002E80FE5D|nr:trypsin-like peptidase domain-containing protein [Streptomyces sp. NBC_00536]WUC79672.1 trypsin-like peptidase domain-containing protein [Streptomyces sp. NBC_00536]
MKVRRSSVVIAATVVLGALVGPSASADQVDPKKIYERAAPATVLVTGKYGAGTGFVYDAGKGLIATAAHVVQGEPSLKVSVGDRPPAPARVVGIDPCEDLAVLTFASVPPDLKALEFGTSKDVQTADTVISLGYPAGLGDANQKVVYTAGSVQNPSIVNAEPSTSLPRYPATIEHSATINPGNSGGPLLNSKGKVVGINVLASTGETQGQFYAITSDHARPLLDTLADGAVKNDPGWTLVGLDDPDLSAYYVEAKDQTDAENAQKKLIADGVTGVFVIDSRTNSPAAKAQLGAGDVLTTMKDTPVASVADVCDILESSPAGEKVPLEGVYSTNADGTKTKFGEAWSADLVLDKGTGPGH